jgi:hypothetical protein
MDSEISKLIEILNLFTKESSFNIESSKDLSDESKVVKIISIM